MDDTTNHLIELGHGLQSLMEHKLNLMRPDIEEQLHKESAADAGKIAYLLDELYDTVLWGKGLEEYQRLLLVLEKLNPESAKFYLEELNSLQLGDSVNQS